MLGRRSCARRAHRGAGSVRRVLIVGGAGVFGRRLAEGLRETTNADLIIAGRSRSRAEEAALTIGAHEVAVLDRQAATSQHIRALNPDLVIDAAGPFQGADLRFARAVIESGAHYLDLADARDFSSPRFPRSTRSRASGAWPRSLAPAQRPR